MFNVGSMAIAGWIAQIAFFVLALRVWAELRLRTAVIFVALWLAGYFGFPLILYGEGFFMPYVAMLDVVMLLMLNRAAAPISLR